MSNTAEQTIELEVPLLLPGVEAEDDACLRRLEAALENQAGLTRAHVEIGGVADRDRRARYLAQIDRFAWIMDSLIPLPLVGGVGLDPFVGLVPVVGDALGFVLASFVVVRAAQLGVPRELLSRLLAIQVNDLLLGSLPVVGDVFDAVYPANQKCAKLIHEHLASQR
jgi:hypothetical protein